MKVTITEGERCAIWWMLFQKDGIGDTDTDNAIDLQDILDLDTRFKNDFESDRPFLRTGKEYELERSVLRWLVEFCEKRFQTPPGVPISIGYYAKPMLRKLKAVLEKKPEATAEATATQPVGG